MNVFISGGCKNGKSFYAQRLARRQADEAGSPLYYIATMIPHDEEDHARIRRHLTERDGWGVTTLETGSTVFVSDYIYSEACEYSETVEAYRQGLAAADRALASVCERVIEISGGMEEIWK